MIPFILLGISIASGAFGVVEGTQGISKLLEAENIIEENKKRYEEECNITRSALNDFRNELEKVGKAKENLHHLRKEIKRCLDSIRKRAKLKDIPLNNGTIVKIDSFCSNIQTDIEYTDELLKGIFRAARAAGFSYLSYLGAVGIATSIGTASTGTAIASLSGAAAENAILAWFGGGALTAGGGGIALGSAVLSGIVAGPVIFSVGISLSKAGEKALTQARKFESQVKTEVKKMEILRKEMKLSQKWLSLYRKVAKAIENKVYKLLKEIEHANSEDEIKKLIVSLILIVKGGIKPLLEVNILENCSFKVSDNARRIIEEHSRILGIQKKV